MRRIVRATAVLLGAVVFVAGVAFLGLTRTRWGASTALSVGLGQVERMFDGSFEVVVGKLDPVAAETVGDQDIGARLCVLGMYADNRVGCNPVHFFRAASRR